MGVGPTFVLMQLDADGNAQPISAANPLRVGPGSSGGAGFLAYVGRGDEPIGDTGFARPSTDGPVYWIMANGVTPSNAEAGDIIFNADA